MAQKARGGMLVFAGISHLTFARRAFRAQLPDWVPLTKSPAASFIVYEYRTRLGSAFRLDRRCFPVILLV